MGGMELPCLGRKERHGEALPAAFSWIECVWRLVARWDGCFLPVAVKSGKK